MKSNYKPLIVAVFLVIAQLIVGISHFSKPNTIEVRGILSYQAPPPTLIGIAQGAQIADSAALVQNASAVIGGVGDPGAVSSDDNENIDIGAVQDPGQPIGPSLDGSETVRYVIKKGDNLSEIASRFNISVDSIVSANPNIRKKALHVGESLIIPGVGGIAASDPEQSSTLPNFNNEFKMPAQGYNWGILHNYNAVDIANSCGTPVVASAEGLVIPDENIPNVPGGWNGGYGNFVLIQHPFGSGIRTRYAHLEQVFVQIGDYVKQGQQIGLMGESGEATGCHVHFEVIGAQNPFVK